MPAKRTVLDAFNDRAEERYLHPTKGWRSLNAKRSVAAMITAEMRHGRRGFDTLTIGKMLRGVRT